MRYLTLGEVIQLHRAVLEKTGDRAGIHDLGALDSALAQPGATFDGVDLHLTLVDKAAALCFSLVRDHPFLDGNKRVGHAAMETFLQKHTTTVASYIQAQLRMITSSHHTVEKIESAFQPWIRTTLRVARPRSRTYDCGLINVIGKRGRSPRSIGVPAYHSFPAKRC